MKETSVCSLQRNTVENVPSFWAAFLPVALLILSTSDRIINAEKYKQGLIHGAVPSGNFFRIIKHTSKGLNPYLQD